MKDIYTEEGRMVELEEGVISAAEEGFMSGYMAKA